MSQNSPQQGTLKILVVDDHELILSGTLDLLKRHYPQAEILTAKTTQDALQQVVPPKERDAIAKQIENLKQIANSAR